MEQRSVKVLQLSAQETAALRAGVNLIHKNVGNFIIYKDPTTPEDPYKACRNVCRHQRGLFVKDIEDAACNVVRCTKHNWKLDTSTMKYVNPPDSFTQELLFPEVDDEGRLTLVELNPPEPWERDPRPPQRIEPGEVKVTFFAHACMEVKLGDKTMFFDPWLTGPAFARGWWLQHEPPADWLERLSRADLIYISHEHSDHLSYPTLELLSKKNPNIPIYVGDTSVPVFCRLKQSGVKLNCINICKFGVWQDINADTRFMILMDGVHPEFDTCILIDYKGRSVARRSTEGFTGQQDSQLRMNWSNSLSHLFTSEEWKERFMANDRKNLLFHKKEVVREVNPKVYCPFAGFFLEAHPADKYILNNNPKNKPEQLAAFINRHLDSVMTWTPKPGSTVDLALALGDPADRRLAIVDPPPETKLYKDTWDFDFYIDKINESIDNEIFAYPDWIPFYYEWIGFKNYDLVLRMIETDDYFQPVEGGYDFLVDFMDLSFPSQRPTRKHAYLEIKNRIGVHRQTVLHGLFWDDLYLGFQNRLSRDPDTFHFKFWNHVQILLSLQPPDWEGFLSRQRRLHSASGKLPRAVWKPPRSKPTVNRLLGVLVQAKALLVPATMALLAILAYNVL
ncbi:cytidine monophosphate-N-acetylneuraminic acid hydroxylase-like [Branchiostoma floridae]|uniref:Cytidine monophosphate-N-acetylneuraminic acid hydroxylase-like n=1 Tax=Branchiostoma floridae TaxID=7739 RepID=A0A9J7MHW1_BRAFL|nr:cytidine monophosphate-N-acetylneuraminic acid hydroxylase-like [Branchiostoma floridae]